MDNTSKILKVLLEYAINNNVKEEAMFFSMASLYLSRYNLIYGYL